ncbi:MAG: carboxypeptidase regulatory-like domain-containing protein, partial [Deltaproteobacteria bacterium]|nr:carboxypeptidase regulatory-like domain-containing protein [Deltaproteobacteria bacterium]
MKKALLLMSLFLVVAVVAFGAEFGAIKGVVKDVDGQPLPGVNVTLSGSKIVAMSAVTSNGGHFRFLNLPVASDYNLKLEISGFKTHIQEEMTITFGKDINLTINMEMATLQEEVVVVSQAPVIDTKRVQVGVNISNEMLMGLPTARNPWVLLEMMPGMLVDKSDVGGSEGGQQSNYIGNGTDPMDSTWNIDGANITDNSALGSTPAYLNPSLYDEIQITYGNNDISMQTGGVQINMITNRGGNKYSGTFFMDVERNAWQSDNVPEELSDLGYTAGGVNRFYLYGANFGGPIVKDRAWFYGSWGVQDI